MPRKSFPEVRIVAPQNTPERSRNTPKHSKTQMLVVVVVWWCWITTCCSIMFQFVVRVHGSRLHAHVPDFFDGSVFHAYVPDFFDGSMPLHCCSRVSQASPERRCPSDDLPRDCGDLHQETLRWGTSDELPRPLLSGGDLPRVSP